jgi:hypothetical protein
MMNQLRRSLSALALAGLLATPALAHHSRSVFDLEQEVTLEGVVSELEWTNPHVYIHLETDVGGDAPAVWEIEASPPALMRRRGWTRETLAAGDRVSVRANPARDAGRAMALGVAVETADGAVLDMLNAASFSDQGAEPDAGADGLAGVWLTEAVLPVLGPMIFGPTDWPVTEKGAAALAAFEESQNPGRDCVAYTAPFLMVFPDAKSIAVDDARVVIRSEFEGVERVVHFDTDNHEGAAVAPHGHSIGRWEGETLVVDTALFAEHRMGNAFKLPSGPDKRLVERFEPDADGLGLTYRFALTDPEYLTEAISGAVRWDYRPDRTFATEPCDLENARRYLEG